MSNVGLPPADLSKLKGVLGGAKAIMDRVSSEQPQHDVSREKPIPNNQLTEKQIPRTKGVAPNIVNGKPHYRNMETSKMPDFIKEAMLNSPIPQLSGPNHTFSLDDVGDLIDETNPIREMETIQKGDNINISESVLRDMIKDVVKSELLNFMSETFTKQISERTIKKTINTLIKEGKIKTKRKINS